MKSRGLFPHAGGGRKNLFGGAAGNSTGNTKPGPSNDGYKTGRLGWRAGPSGGGQRIADKLSGRPVASGGVNGAGGCAWDRSMRDAFDNEVDPAHQGKFR